MKIIKAILRFWNQYNFVGRLFWTATMAISFLGMITFCYFTFKRYFSDPVSMIVDTEYIHWNFSFPAVSICLIKGKFSSSLIPLIDKFNITYKGSKTNFLRLVHTCMFENSLRFDLTQLKKCGELESVYGIDVEEINAMVLPQDCKQILDFLSFNNKLLINCSRFLKFHKTEIGYCFIFNTIIDNNFSFENLKSKYTYFSKTKKLSMRLKGFKLWRYTVQVHSPEEIPFFNSISKEMYTSEILHSYSVEIVTTNLDASKKSIGQRGCRFPHEKLNGSPFHYSFSTCMSFLKIQLELKECNCTHPSSPEIYRSSYCDLSGKICLLNGKVN
ncbi:uncharacterized protein LOC129952225 isoform X2 [Eupeodes corollae]|uniref:uncharacterized protein LOC129952225 isoform X2 n=1 Tax=Eupeodes corollae TaxID=290404 RepID=UPI00249034E3|nr:uncharacterized protein LOC129952225 isoform X2 [Eupeodes corollae]